MIAGAFALETPFYSRQRRGTWGQLLGWGAGGEEQTEARLLPGPQPRLWGLSGPGPSGCSQTTWTQGRLSQCVRTLDVAPLGVGRGARDSCQLAWRGSQRNNSESKKTPSEALTNSPREKEGQGAAPPGQKSENVTNRPLNFTWVSRGVDTVGGSAGSAAVGRASLEDQQPLGRTEEAEPRDAEDKPGVRSPRPAGGGHTGWLAC